MLRIFELVAKSVADPNRVRILKLLEAGELCVCQISATLGLAPATVSKHLAQLRGAGLVDLRKEGRWVFYRLAELAANPYAQPVLAMLRGVLADDPSLAEDRRMLTRVAGLPLQTVCEKGRAALAEECC